MILLNKVFTKTILTATRIALIFILFIYFSSELSGQTWRSTGLGSSIMHNGKRYYNWNDPANWDIGSVPATSNLGTLEVGQRVYIHHNIFYDLGVGLINRGRIQISTIPGGVRPELYFPSAINIENFSTGEWIMFNADLLQEIFINGNPNNPGSGTFKNIGGRIDINGARIEIAQDWTSDGGSRYFRLGCLFTGQNYSNSNAQDTLIDVCLILGHQSSGNLSFAGDPGRMYFDGVNFQIQDSGAIIFDKGNVEGHINTLYLNDCDPSCSSGGGNECSSCQDIITSSSIIGTVELDYWCAANLQDNGNMFTGSKIQSCPNASLPYPCQDCRAEVLDVDAGSDEVICVGESVQLNATLSGGRPPYSSFNWTPANSLDDPNIANPIASPSTTTEYIVSATDYYDWLARDTVLVTVISTTIADVQVGPCVNNESNISITVEWSGGEYVEDIMVEIGDSTYTIPAASTATSPTTLLHTMPADGTCGNQIFAYFETIPSCGDTTYFNLPPPCDLPPPFSDACIVGSNTIGGMVFRDFNQNGIQEVVETVGVEGIYVTAYGADGNIYGPDITDVNGDWYLTVPAGMNFRVEFTNIPVEYMQTSTFSGINSKTTVQFVQSGTCEIDLGINIPSENCN